MYRLYNYVSVSVNLTLSIPPNLRLEVSLFKPELPLRSCGKANPDTMRREAVNAFPMIEAAIRVRVLGRLVAKTTWTN